MVRTPKLPVFLALVVSSAACVAQQPPGAAVLWLIFAAPFTTRRYIRRKHGCCTKCGYDLRGAEREVCPECGWRREDVS